MLKTVYLVSPEKNIFKYNDISYVVFNSISWLIKQFYHFWDGNNRETNLRFTDGSWISVSSLL